MSDFDFNPNETGFNLKNAYWLGEAAKLAYSNPRSIQEKTKEWGLHHCYFLDKKETDTEAFVAANNQMILCAFRGTQPNKIKDWITDIKIKQVGGAGGECASRL